MTIADLIALQALFVAVVGGVIAVLWKRLETVSARGHKHGNEIQNIILTLHAKGIDVPRRRNGNGA